MNCLVCLQNSDDLIDVYGDHGMRLEIPLIIGQHLWFKPTTDSLKRNICIQCWSSLDTFHSFYMIIKERHNKLSTSEIINEFAECQANSNSEHGEYSIDDTTNDNNDANSDKIDYNGIGSRYGIDGIPENPHEEQNEEKEKETGKAQKQSDTLNQNLNVSKESDFKAKDDKIAKYYELNCDLCQNNFETFQLLLKHFRSVHKREGYIVCCNKKLFKRMSIIDHINSHINPEYLKCQTCGKTFADMRSLKNHINRHGSGSGETKNFKCDECPRQYATKLTLEQHKLIHKPTEENLYNCTECGKSYLTRGLLQTHIKCVHRKLYGKMCHICAKVIKDKTRFEQHQLAHEGVVGPMIQCKQCGAWLKHEYGLRKHMRRHEERSTDHICSECGKSSPTKEALKSHMKYMHSSQKFQCSLCEKSFKIAHALKEHMTTHTGERLYTCPHCPKTFNQSANMYSHRKKVHTAEWEEGRRKKRGQLQDVPIGT